MASDKQEIERLQAIVDAAKAALHKANAAMSAELVKDAKFAVGDTVMHRKCRYRIVKVTAPYGWQEGYTSLHYFGRRILKSGQISDQLVRLWDTLSHG